MSKPHFTNASCPTCNTSFDRLPVEYDEDGGGIIILETRPCFTCGKLLCACCNFFACDGCGQIHCADHLVSIPDEPGRPLHCCAECASECEPLPLPFPPARETRPAIASPEVA